MFDRWCREGSSKSLSEKEEHDLERAFLGFVYRITNLINCRYYIGKKQLIRGNRPYVAGRDFKFTNWRNYYGSSNALKLDIEKLGKENFSREILAVARTKFDLAYQELKFQMKYCVLEDERYYNEIIDVKLRKRKLENPR